MTSRLFASIAFIALAALGSASLAFTGTKTENGPAVVDDDGFRRLEWSDLSPPLTQKAEQALAELNLRIDEMTDEEVAKAMAVVESEGNVLVTDLDGTDVSLQGFLVPIDFDADRVSEFVLVPYFGACIHVPPPPPNQIVFVKYDEGLAMSDLEKDFYTPYRVKGHIKAARAKTDLAEVGYQLTATAVARAKGL